MPEKTASPKLIKKLDRKDMLFCLARVPETRRVVFGSSDFHVYEVDLAADRPAPRLLRGQSHESYVTGLALAGRWAISGGYDGRLIWWDLVWGERVRAVEAHGKWIRDVAASPDGATIASVADDMVCCLWDAETGAKRQELRGHESMTPHGFPSMLYACAFTPDGRHLATADKVGRIVVWDVATGKPLTTLEAPVMYTWDPVQRRHSIGGIRALAFSPRGDRLAVGGIGKIGNIDHLEGPARVEVFDWKKNERTHEFTAEMPKGIVERIAFHPEGDRLLAVGGANDGFLLVLDLKSKSVRGQTKAPAHIHDAEFGDTPETIYTAAHNSVGLYEINWG
jgi:WD40 repeat protein